MYFPRIMQRALLVITALSFVSVGIHSTALGATFNVNSTTDAVDSSPGDGSCNDGSGNCTLRAAVMEINALGENSNTINLQAQIYRLTIDPSTTPSEGSFFSNDAKGDLDIAVSTDILGQGADQTAIEADYDNNQAARVIHVVSNDATNTVSLFNLTIRNGNEPAAVTGDGCGGGIFVEFNQNLNLNRVAVTNNSGDAGGGIYHSGGQGEIAINDSTISGNHAFGSTVCGPPGGGGIYTRAFTTIINSTISGNTTNNYGGGLFNDGSASSVLRNVTVSNNTADLDENNTGNGGGIYDRSPTTIFLRNTIVAGNFDNSTSIPVVNLTPGLSAQVAVPTIHPDCSENGGSIVSEDYNLIGDETGCASAASWNLSTDLVGTSASPIPPQLDPLADNGGPTRTHALQDDSPALDGADPSGCTADSDFTVPLTADQRGEPRPVDGDENGSAICDIGAFELQPTACGDGTVDAGEECDDGNTADNDGCSATCVIEACGDGVLQTDEECDDSNTVNGDGCDSTCQNEAGFTPTCGDGILQTNEECDDGNKTNGDGCDANCNFECGNGTREGNEQCDDGNVVDGDGCSATCTTENLPFVLIGKGGCSLNPAMTGSIGGSLVWLLVPFAGLVWRRRRS